MRTGEPVLKPNGTFNRQVYLHWSVDPRELELEVRNRVQDKTHTPTLSRLNDPSRFSPIESGALTADETFVIPSLEKDPEDLVPQDSVEASGPEKDAINPIAVGANAIRSYQMNQTDSLEMRGKIRNLSR